MGLVVCCQGGFGLFLAVISTPLLSARRSIAEAVGALIIIIVG